MSKLVEVLATLVPDTKSGTPGADAVKVKGNITWVAVADAVPVEVRLYERLFATPQPGSGEMLDELNRESLVTCAAFAEPSLAGRRAVRGCGAPRVPATATSRRRPRLACWSDPTRGRGRATRRERSA